MNQFAEKRVQSVPGASEYEGGYLSLVQTAACHLRAGNVRIGSRASWCEQHQFACRVPVARRVFPPFSPASRPCSQLWVMVVVTVKDTMQ